MRHKPGLPVPLAAFAFASYGFAVGAGSSLLASILGPAVGLSVLAAGASLALFGIVSGSRGIR